MPHASTSPARVYFLHGLLGTAYGHFGAQITAWQQRYSVVPIDLPGHGRCRLDAGPDYLDQALEYVRTVVERFGPGHLVAASHLGAPLAVRLAEARPDLVSSLALTGFAPGMDRDVFTGLLTGFGRLVDDNPELAAEYDRLHTPRWRDTLAAFTEHAVRAFAERAVVPARRFGELGAAGIDTILVNGTLKSLEREAAETAGALGPRVRGRVLDGAGHIASHDAPSAFTATVEEFWIGAALRSRIQETDPHRRLDSLETVAVLTYLTELGLVPDGPPEPETRPSTIEEWGTWAVQRSLVS